VRRFGFGQYCGIELPAESKGMLRQMKHWGKTSLASVAMGHEISVTTVQLARACSVIANGGLLVKPHLVMRRGDQAVPVAPPPRILQPGTAITMRQMMEGVVLFGTGRQNAQLAGYSSGGKTGSAQIYDVAARRFTHMYNASFMGFAPLTNPAVVTVVTVNGTHMFGGTASAPAYKVIMEEALRVLKIPKDLPETLVADNKNSKNDKNGKHEILDDDDAAIADLAADNPSILAEQPADDNASAPPVVLAAAAGPRVPDFQGKTMRAVVEEASAKGLAVQIDGSGIARVQQPPPGSVLRAGERIRVQFAR
jgi:cell division protein FtsI (penicillin-binding protein 3)